MKARKRYTYGYKNDAVRLHIKSPQSILSIPAYVCRQLFNCWDDLNIETDIIELDVENNVIQITPALCSSKFTFVLCTNGSGAGRKVTIPAYIVKEFDLTDGYFKADVLKDGTLHVDLKERLK